MEETHNNTRRRRRSCIGVGKPLSVISTGVLLLIIAFSASAVPLSRSLKSMDASPLVIPDLSAQHTGSWNFGGYGEEEGRKLVDTTNDYGNTGANDKHDPPKRT